MSISNSEFERRYAAVRQAMKQQGLDCLLVAGLGDDFNRGNIRYLTGFGRGGTCIFPADGRPVFLMGPNQSNTPKTPKLVAAHELLELSETADPASTAVTELGRFDGGGKIGIAGIGCMSVPMYLAVKERFGERLADSMGIFEKLRVVKSPEEIANQRVAAAVADDVFAMLRETIRPGQSDFEIYGRLKQAIVAAGCEYSFDLIDAAGGTMNYTFWPTGEKLKANSTLFMEITPAYDGYYAQLPVTLPVGHYPTEINRMARAWEKANAAALKLLRPGTVVSDIYRVLVGTVEKQGYVSPLRPGHAIGLEALDFWSITGDNGVILEPGMVLAMHPSVMTRLGGEACGLGYTYLITETGAERFSKVELSDLID